MKKNHKKPSGRSGDVKVSPTNPSETGFRQIKFPEGKPELEKFIVDEFVSTMKSHQVDIYDLEEPPLQNPENGLDFLIRKKKGLEHLECMEIAPLNGAYKDAVGSYNYREMADWILKKVLEKSKDYRSKSPDIHHLLIYPTAWQFNLTPGVLKLLSYWLDSHDHDFKTITYYEPEYKDKNSGKNPSGIIASAELIIGESVELDENTPSFIQVVPHPQWDFENFDVEKLKATITQKADPTKLIIESKGIVVAKISPPPIKK